MHATSEKSRTTSVVNKKKQQPFFAPVVIQPKLAVGPVDDVYEREADTMADKVMRMSEAQTVPAKSLPMTIQRKCDHCEEEELQRKEEPEEEGILQTKPIADLPIQRKCAGCEAEDEMIRRNEIDTKAETHGEPLSCHDKITASPAEPSPMLIQRKFDHCEEEELQRKEEPEEEGIRQTKPIADLPIQRKCAACEEEKQDIQRKSTGIKPPPVVTPLVHQTLQSSGHTLDPCIRSFMESRFGYDFGNVQIHNNSLAHQSSSDIHARAYTHRNHIVFGAGQYQPNTHSGKQLLAHELTHVVQQHSSSRLRPKNAAVNFHNEGNVRTKQIQRKNSGESDLSDKNTGNQKAGKCPTVPTNEGFIDPDPPCPLATHAGVMKIKEFKFCPDSSTLTDPSELNELDQILNNNLSTSHFLILGYSSKEGNTGYNFVLSCRRANTIFEALSQKMTTKSGKEGAEKDAEISRRIATGSQGPTSEFGSAPEKNRIAVLYINEANGAIPEEPQCKDAPKHIGDVKPEVGCDPHSINLEGTDGTPQRRHFFFCSDSDVLVGEDASAIGDFAFKQASVSGFIVHGFASEEGTPDYNKRLSCNRALRVARELVNAGVRAEQITEVSGIGRTQSFATGHDEPSRSLNRVVVVQAVNAEISTFKDGKQDAKTNAQKTSIIATARSRLLAGQYKLGADVFISFWTCGTTKTVAEGVKRLHILLPTGDEDEQLTVDANGKEEGLGVNTVRLSNTALRTDNPVECVMGRLADMAFHHAVISNQILSSDKEPPPPAGFLPSSELKDNLKIRHDAGLHLIFLAGLGACLGGHAEPGKSSHGNIPTGISQPLQDDPLEQMAPPACADTSQPSRLLTPPKGAKDRIAPSFIALDTDFAMDQNGLLDTLRIAPNIENQFKSVKDLDIKTSEKTPVIKPSSKVSLIGKEDVFNDYEIGFIQTILDDLTIAQYITGQEAIQKLPVPIRAAQMKGDAIVPQPWMSLNAMKRPDNTGNVALAATWQMNTNFALTLGFFTSQSGNNDNILLDTLQRHTNIAIWLVSRRLGGPLDRFTVVPLDGGVYKLIQNLNVDFKLRKGDPLRKGDSTDLENKGENENIFISGEFVTREVSKEPADFTLARFGNPTSGNVDTIRQFQKIVAAPNAPAAGAGMNLSEYIAQVTEILDTMTAFSEEELTQGGAGKAVPRLGYVFDPLTITIRINPVTGRMIPFANIGIGREDRSVLINSPGIGPDGLDSLAAALGLRLEKMDPQNQGRQIILDSNTAKNLPRDTKGFFLQFVLQPSQPAATEKNLIDQPRVKEQMAMLWACTELTLSLDDDPFNKGGLAPREFGLTYFMDRDHVLHRVPANAILMGKPILQDSNHAELKLPCGAIDRVGMTVGNVHTHAIEDGNEANPSGPDQETMARSRHCGRQFYIVSKHAVVQYFSDQRKPVTLGDRRSVLGPEVRCDTKAIEI